MSETPERVPGSVNVRPMFEVLADFGWNDAAKWPEPYPFHALEDE